MAELQVKVITLAKAANMIGLSSKTLRNRIYKGVYPSTIFMKINGTWMANLEEWNKWHQNR